MLSVLTLWGLNVYSQNKIDFSGWAPSNLDQYKGTCYAYATTYTALTIKLAIKINLSSAQDINENAFSPAFTASRLQQHKSFLKRIFTSCSVGGNIEKAAEILKNEGAVPVKNFRRHTNTTETELSNAAGSTADKSLPISSCCYAVQPAELADAAAYRIQGFECIIDTNTSRENTSTIVEILKKYLKVKEPVICAIRQTSKLRSNTDLIYHIESDVDANNNYKTSNHAICIVGFNDEINGGSVLIKNNYKTFGSNGLAWINYEDFKKYLSYAIVLKAFNADTFPMPLKYDKAELF